MKYKIVYTIAILLFLTLNCKNQKENITNVIAINQEDSKAIIDRNASVNNDDIGPINNCIKCKIDMVKEVKENIHNLNEDQAYTFLCCINESCSQNVEFTEFSNEVLYLLLNERPNLVLKILSKHSNISLNYIKKQLENPVNDKIDLNNVLKSIRSVDNYEAIKKELLSSIQLAIDKYK